MAIRFRGHTKWDPALIIYQILTIQLLSYASLCALLLFLLTITFGPAPAIKYIFDHRMIRLGSSKLVILAHLMNALVGAQLLKIFIERSKSCLDFSMTFYILHFFLVWTYSQSVPDTFMWYFINISSASVMCITSEYLCRREELKSIPISATV